MQNLGVQTEAANFSPEKKNDNETDSRLLFFDKYILREFIVEEHTYVMKIYHFH